MNAQLQRAGQGVLPASSLSEGVSRVMTAELYDDAYYTPFGIGQRSR
jgi:hypothetical protein